MTNGQEKSSSKSHTRADVSVLEEGVYASISQPYHPVSMLAPREAVFVSRGLRSSPLVAVAICYTGGHGLRII